MQAPAGGMREVYHNLDSVYPRKEAQELQWVSVILRPGK